MSKNLVLYKSRYGSTEKYAKWISDSINADIFNIDHIDSAILEKYDVIIFGGYLHAVGIAGIDFIKNNFEKISDKKIIIFSVGCSPIRKEISDSIYQYNFSEEKYKNIQYFAFRGAFDSSKMYLIDKILMFVMKLIISLKKDSERSEDEKGLLEVYKNPADWTTRESIKPLLEDIKAYNI